MRRTLVLSLALVAMLNAPAAAQTCQGLPSFSTGSMQLTGNMTFENGMDSFGAAFGYGQPDGAFGTVGIGTTSFDGFDGSSFDVGIGGGYQMKVGARKKMHLCPVASFSLLMGPNDVFGSGVDMSTQNLAFGFALGTQLPGSPKMDIIPTGGLGLAYMKVKADGGSGSGSASETYAVMDLGVGFIFNSQISVRPGISIPLGLDGGDTGFGMTVGYNFGNTNRRARR
jgi:hypothetical protein